MDVQLNVYILSSVYFQDIEKVVSYLDYTD